MVPPPPRLFDQPNQRGIASRFPQRFNRRFSFAAELIEQHGDLFIHSQMKSRIAGLLRRFLPPIPRRTGRPGLANVTAAIRLHDELKRSSVEQSPSRYGIRYIAP
jgi:hypothetical protein